MQNEDAQLNTLHRLLLEIEYPGITFYTYAKIYLDQS